MKIKVAAAAPEISSGQPGQSFANILSVISRARADGAALLVLPDKLPEDVNQGAVERQAGPMAVYPLTKPSLTRDELMSRRDMDVLCYSADTPATSSSRYENEELAAMASYENMAVVVMACPLGGDGGRIYTGQCVIAQNGTVLKSDDGYVVAEVTVPGKDVKAPVTGTVDNQPIRPWTPFPEMLPRILRLQADALSRRMRREGATHISVAVGEDASGLLALCVCVKAVEQLKLSRKNIHVSAATAPIERIAARLGVSLGQTMPGLVVDTTDLTARALEGVRPTHYAVNATVPRGVARLVMRWFANTCGDRELSIPIRAVLNSDEEPWELYDFLLHFALVYDLPRWALTNLVEDTFKNIFQGPDIQKAQERFFADYRRPPQCDCPAVFPVDLKKYT